MWALTPTLPFDLFRLLQALASFSKDWIQSPEKLMIVCKARLERSEMDLGEGSGKSRFPGQSSGRGKSTSFLHISPANRALLQGCSSSSPGLTIRDTWASLSSLQSAVMSLGHLLPGKQRHHEADH